MALALKSGNTFQFDSIAASGNAACDFGLPIKKVMTPSDKVKIQSADGTDLFLMEANLVYEFPNDFGYPGTLNVENADAGNAITPTFLVVEYGDVVNSEYFEEVGKK